MDTNKSYVVRYLWSGMYEDSLIVLYNDHFWQEYKIPCLGHWVKDGKSRKEILDLRKMVQKKMTQDEAEAFIRERINVYKELCK